MSAVGGQAARVAAGACAASLQRATRRSAPGHYRTHTATLLIAQLLEQFKVSQRARFDRSRLAGKFKGVRKIGKGFQPNITVNGQQIFLPLEPTAEAAARIFDRAVIRRDGRWGVCSSMPARCSCCSSSQTTTAS